MLLVITLKKWSLKSADLDCLKNYTNVLFIIGFDPTLAGVFCAHLSKNAHEKTLHPGSFPSVGAFDFLWSPTEVQSAHFQYESKLIVEHQKTKNGHKSKMCGFFSVSILFSVGSFPCWFFFARAFCATKLARMSALFFRFLFI